MARRLMIILLVLLLAFSVALVAGCNKTEESTDVDEVEVTETEDEQPSEETQTSGDTITMNGRSVMGMWMEYWGYDWEGPVTKDGYSLDYRELDADLSNIANSFAENVSGLPEGSVVFFKFCFADFYGDNLSELTGIIDDVVATAQENGLRLIIGNALPMGEGDSELVTEYEDYNSYLENIAGENGDVWVYDFYGILAGDDGFLKSDYNTGDSHLTDSAYSVLDETFFPLLDTVSGG